MGEAAALGGQQLLVVAQQPGGRPDQLGRVVRDGAPVADVPQREHCHVLPEEAGGGRPVLAAELLAQPGQVDRAHAPLGGTHEQVAQLTGERPGAQGGTQVGRPTDRVVLGLLTHNVQQLTDDQILLRAGEQPG